MIDDRRTGRSTRMVASAIWQAAQGGSSVVIVVPFSHQFQYFETLIRDEIKRSQGAEEWVQRRVWQLANGRFVSLCTAKALERFTYGRQVEVFRDHSCYEQRTR